MKARVLPLLLLAIASACHCDKNEPEPTMVCGVVNPAENLPWLKAIIDEFKKDTSAMASQHYVQQSTYQGNTVFIVGTCIPWCELSCFGIKDCEGKDFDNLIELDGPATVLWKAENSSCTFGQ